MRFLVSILLLVLSTTSFAQLKVKLAEDHFNNMAYYDAAPIYGELADKYINKKKGSVDYLYKAAIAYGKIFEFEKSNIYYEAFFKENPKGLNAEDIQAYVNQLRMVRQYAKSVDVSRIGLQLFPDNSVFQIIAEEGLAVDQLFKDSVLNTVNIMPFNSEEGDFAPFFVDDKLIFTTKSVHRGFLTGRYAWDHANFTNIVYTKFSEGKWQKPKPLSGVYFSRKHDGPVAFNEEGNKMVITHNFSSKEKKDGIRYLALYLSDKNGEGDWGDLIPFPHDEKNSNTGHGCFSPDGNRLFFVSDRDGGKGRTDIYYSDFKNGEWQKPVNLEVANTEGEEMFPYVSSDNKLYFASNGLFGLGGLDVFELDLNDPSAIPRNLGASINSPADDFGFVSDSSGNSGYFSSDRDDFVDRIYSWEYKPLSIVLEGLVYANYDPKKPIANQRVEIRSGENEAFIIETDESGSYKTTVNRSEKYQISSAKEFFIQDEKVELNTSGFRKDTIVKRDIHLNPTTIEIRLQVVEKESKKAIPNAKVSILDLKENKDSILTTDDKGYLELEVPRHRDYWSRASKKGYIDDETAFKTGNYSDQFISLELELPKINKGEKFKLENIFYDLNEATLRSESQHSLDKLAEFLIENNLKIELSAHTDSRGSNRYNQKLSQRRAQSCVDYLLQKGVEKRNIVARGYGESQLVNHCKDGVKCSEDEHQENRRTEVKILEIK